MYHMVLHSFVLHSAQQEFGICRIRGTSVSRIEGPHNAHSKPSYPD